MRTLTFWQMKRRACQFGETGAAALLRRLQVSAPADRPVRFHLMGHSFGCIVVSACVAGAPGPQSARVDSLTLVQGALSLWSYCSRIPMLPERRGYFHRLVSDRLVRGPSWRPCRYMIGRLGRSIRSAPGSLGRWSSRLVNCRSMAALVRSAHVGPACGGGPYRPWTQRALRLAPRRRLQRRVQPGHRPRQWTVGCAQRHMPSRDRTPRLVRNAVGHAGPAMIVNGWPARREVRRRSCLTPISTQLIRPCPRMVSQSLAAGPPRSAVRTGMEPPAVVAAISLPWHR